MTKIIQLYVFSVRRPLRNFPFSNLYKIFESLNYESRWTTTTTTTKWILFLSIADDDHSIKISVRLVWKIYFVVVIIRQYLL